MSKVKAGGSAKSLRDSKPKYLGVKLGDGQKAKVGSIIVRQRGTKIMAGENVEVGKDHTLYAKKEGTVKFKTKRKTNFDGRKVKRRIANII